MKKTGELLKEAREKKGLTLNEVSMTLKISIRALGAIESGDSANLPSKTFLRGFVQSYATFLKLDTQRVLNSFYEEMGPMPSSRVDTTASSIKTSEIKPEPSLSTSTESTPAPQEPAEEIPKQVEEKVVSPNMALRKKPVEEGIATDNLPVFEKKSNRAAIIFSTVAFVAVIGIVLINRIIERYQREAEIPNPASVISTIEATPASSSAVVPATSPEVATTTTSPVSEIKTTSTMPLRSEQPPKASTTPATVATNPPAESSTPKVPPPATAPAEATAAPVKKKAQELIIEALDSVSVEIISGNGKVEKLQLSAEQVHVVRSRSGFKISLSNGSAANITLNGKDLGVPASTAAPVSLSY